MMGVSSDECIPGHDVPRNEVIEHFFSFFEGTAVGIHSDKGIRDGQVAGEEVVA